MSFEEQAIHEVEQRIYAKAIECAAWKKYALTWENWFRAWHTTIKATDQVPDFENTILEMRKTHGIKE
jgi:hypothetical protein